MRYFVGLLLASATLVPGQIISVGGKIGIPSAAVDDASGDSVNVGRWLVGPSIELHLNRRLSVEANALYRSWRVSYSSIIPAGAQLTPLYYASTEQNTRAWEFPVLLKYRFTSWQAKPFIDAGFNPTYTSSDIASTYSCIGTSATCPTSEPQPFLQPRISSQDHNYHGGPVGGVGMEFKTGRVRFSPEVRYTHFNRPNVHEIEVMLGVSF